MEEITGAGASVGSPESAVPASINDLPSEIIADICEALTSRKLFASLLEFRLTCKTIGAEAARVLVLRTERRVWTNIVIDVGSEEADRSIQLNRFYVSVSTFVRGSHMKSIAKSLALRTATKTTWIF
jgi:hypothetical protein